MTIVDKVLGKDEKNTKKENKTKKEDKAKKEKKTKKEDKAKKEKNIKKEDKAKKEKNTKKKSVASKEKSKPKTQKNKKKKAALKNLSFRNIAHRVLVKPVITEKATQLQAKGVYSFYVYPKANKIEIKKAIKEVFNVMPEKVRTIKVPGKSVRYGRQMGRTKKRKKALVFLKQGDKIELTSKK